MRGGKTKVLQCSTKTPPQTARKRLFVWLSYSLSNRDKIGHKKQINKVLHPCVDTLPFGNFGTAGTNKKHVEQLKFYSYGNYVKNNI